MASELAATSPPETAARSRTPGMAPMISFTLKPAEARFSIP